MFNKNVLLKNSYKNQYDSYEVFYEQVAVY